MLFSLLFKFVISSFFLMSCSPSSYPTCFLSLALVVTKPTQLCTFMLLRQRVMVSVLPKETMVRRTQLFSPDPQPHSNWRKWESEQASLYVLSSPAESILLLFLAIYIRELENFLALPEITHFRTAHAGSTPYPRHCPVQKRCWWTLFNTQDLAVLAFVKGQRAPFLTLSQTRDQLFLLWGKERNSKN